MTDVYGSCSLQAAIGDNDQSMGPDNPLTHSSHSRPCDHVSEVEVGPKKIYVFRGSGSF